MQHPYEMDLKIPTALDTLPIVINQINYINLDKTNTKSYKQIKEINDSFNKKIHISNLINTNYSKSLVDSKRRKIDPNINISNINIKKLKFEKI